MINIDKYIDAIFRKLAYTDNMLVWMNAHVGHGLKYDRKYFNIRIFEDKRFTVYDIQKANLEDIIRSSPFDTENTIRGVLERTKADIENNQMWPLIAIVSTELQKIDFLELAVVAGKIDFLNYLENKLLYYVNNESLENNETKIKWIGKPTQLGFIMCELVSNGFIEAPTHKTGDINYSDFARQLKNVFEFEGNSFYTLKNSLSPETNNMENENKAKFVIPHIKDVS